MSGPTMSGSKIVKLLSTKVFHASSEDRRRQTKSLEQIAQETIGETYVEEDPSVVEWFRGLVPSSHGVTEYARELFPSARWMRRYNLHWLLGDSIAGITVGLVVVPQAMAYALLARLPPAFGLYTTFTGACVYWIFGTSKDIVIGTTAVGSLLVGGVVSKIETENPGVFKPQEIAHALSFLAGIILLVLGILRLGWLIEFIPYVPISAFVTSASITIISTQIPTILGITGINTREAPYKVYINTIKSLPNTTLDAAIGISSLVLLILIRNFCTKMEVCQPNKKKVWSLLSSLRLTFTILMYTLISWLVHRNVQEGREKFRIVGHIDRGFSHANVPPMDSELFRLVASELPAIVVILIVEHIAIAKSFGRIYGYNIHPSQEMIAQGASNILSPFVGGYVCTGSFGASAVLSKSAVRTPLAGLFSAMVLVLALYALTEVFHYIPNAALAALIIHCTVNLLTPPKSLYKYWQLSPFELFIWICGVVVAFFTDLEIAIYITVGLSFAMLLIRMSKPSSKFRGTVRVTQVVREERGQKEDTHCSNSTSTLDTHSEYVEPARHVFLPYDNSDNHNSKVKVEPAYPGVFIYRFSESFNYINQAYHIDHLTKYIKSHTRRSTPRNGIRASDHLWCDDLPSKQQIEDSSSLPVLRAIVLDFSTVNFVDVTSVQGLIDLRQALDRFAAPELVEWHMAGVNNRWTRRALASAGFGFPVGDRAGQVGDWCPAYTVAAYPLHVTEEQRQELIRPDLEGQTHGKLSRTMGMEGDGEKESVDFMRATALVSMHKPTGSLVPVYGVDRPYFHLDLNDAVGAAVRNVKSEDRRRVTQVA